MISPAPCTGEKWTRSPSQYLGTGLSLQKSFGSSVFRYGAFALISQILIGRPFSLAATTPDRPNQLRTSYRAVSIIMPIFEISVNAPKLNYCEYSVEKQGFYLTEVIEALETFNNFESTIRKSAIALYASELGINKLHFYMISALLALSHLVQQH